MRNLAHVERIASIRNVDNSDNLQVVNILGWQVVVNKKDSFKEGDLVCYIEIDSIAPDRWEFEFLRQRKFRVKTIQLRKTLSQGLVMPLNILPNDVKWKEGDDVTDILGIRKAEDDNDDSDIVVTQNKFERFIRKIKYKIFNLFQIEIESDTKFPKWIAKTEENRIQGFPSYIYDELRNYVYEATEKLDGTSGTFFVKKKFFGWEYGICSRNKRLNKTNGKHYLKISNQLGLKKKMIDICKKNSATTLVLQGEIIGEGIQKNKYKIKGIDLYIFNFILDGKKYDNETFSKWIKRYNIKSVPLVNSNFVLDKDINNSLLLAEAKSALNQNQEREGIVCRNYKNNISFKIISNKFLLKEDNT